MRGGCQGGILGRMLPSLCLQCAPEFVRGSVKVESNDAESIAGGTRISLKNREEVVKDFVHLTLRFDVWYRTKGNLYLTNQQPASRVVKVHRNLPS